MIGKSKTCEENIMKSILDGVLLVEEKKLEKNLRKACGCQKFFVTLPR